MGSDGAAQARCPDTGLSVPECSCRRCLEAMLRQRQPGLLAGEFRVTRTADGRGGGAGGRPGRRAA